jgi:hypothetical protein
MELETSAIPIMNTLALKSRNEFTEQSLSRLAQIYLKKERYSKNNCGFKTIGNRSRFSSKCHFCTIEFDENLLRSKRIIQMLWFMQKKYWQIQKWMIK